MTDLETTLYEAVKYLLDRSQTDPDLGFLVGPATESFARLCRAEAAVTGEDVATVERRRAVDLQPPHRRRRAEVLELREKVAECEGDHYDIERDRDEAEDECRELRAENSKLKEQLKDRPPYCPHCNRCPVCGWNRHPCVCP